MIVSTEEEIIRTISETSEDLTNEQRSCLYGMYEAKDKVYRLKDDYEKSFEKMYPDDEILVGMFMSVIKEFVNNACVAIDNDIEEQTKKFQKK